MKRIVAPLFGLAVLPAGPALAERPVIEVAIGRPTLVQKLFYETLYEKRPYPDATLYYYDNGVYKIISRGEEHYGVYSVSGHMSDVRYDVRYVSLPSSDWGGKTVHHALHFDRDNGIFTQQARWEDDPGIPPQHGRFTQSVNTVDDPRVITWESHADPAQKSR